MQRGEPTDVSNTPRRSNPPTDSHIAPVDLAFSARKTALHPSTRKTQYWWCMRAYIHRRSRARIQATFRPFSKRYSSTKARDSFTTCGYVLQLRRTEFWSGWCCSIHMQAFSNWSHCPPPIATP